MATKQYQYKEDDDKKLSTPTMSRSRNQLAGAYAPGAFFTFEGGLGSCIAVPDQSDVVDQASIQEPTKEQIVLRLREVWQSWFTRAYSLNGNGREIDPRQCLDEMLLRGSVVHPLSGSGVEFVNPVKMGYAPAPLTFVCNSCGLFKSFDSAHEAAKASDFFRSSKCQNPKGKGKCQWRQLDVIFVHWSGEWQAATPGMWEWSDRDKKTRLFGEVCSLCHTDKFILKTESPRIGEWYFQCANPTCNDRRRTWLQNDPFTTEVFQDKGSKRVGERRMEPVSYRASSAFYAHHEQFVMFSEKDQGLLKFLEEGQERELGNFIAGLFGFAGTMPNIEEMKAVLLNGGHDAEWESYERQQKMRAMAEFLKDANMVAAIEAEHKKLVDRWLNSEPPLVPVAADLPGSLKTQILRRSEFSSRFDPFSLAVEHEALKRSKLSKTSQSGERAPFVRFRRLDKDLAPKDEAAQAKQEEKTVDLMSRLGFAEFGLIRDFELCRFTHGYTRVFSVPVEEKRNQNIPVRLKLFEPLKNGRRPIYVVTQANEALYIQLDPKQVFAWLGAVGVKDLPNWTPDSPVRLGGKLLEQAEPFGRYFSMLQRADASTYRYVYTLLHTYSHLIMKSIAEFSGLDVGSLGEYLFPADLAFVVYRNGTTMDLGNLSSLWRNENNQFLKHLLHPSTHSCNSGSLCDLNGSACPDCIMVPETSCVAQNRLLSRAVLQGGPAPREDLTHEDERIPGFLEITNANAAV